MTTAEELQAVKDTFGIEPSLQQESGNDCIVLPALKLPPGCKPAEAMAVFVRGPVAGYETRLFFECPVSNSDGQLPTIHPQMILGRQMHAASIRGILPTLPPNQAILAHLRVYQK